MEAEYMAASAATQEVMWLNHLNNKLVSNSRPTRIHEDYVDVLAITGEASTLRLGDFS
jgi:hypothetical protein